MLWKRFAPPLTLYGRQGLSRPIRPNGRVAQFISRGYNSNPQNTGQYTPDPTDQNDGEDDTGQGRSNDSDPNFRSTILKMLETAATTAVSIAILGYDYVSRQQH